MIHCRFHGLSKRGDLKLLNGHPRLSDCNPMCDIKSQYDVVVSECGSYLIGKRS